VRNNKAGASIAYPDLGSDAFLSLEPYPGSSMNFPDNFSESLDQILGLKIVRFFYADPDLGSGNFFTLNPGSGINIPDPQHLPARR